MSSISTAPVSDRSKLLEDISKRTHFQHGPIDLIIEAWGGNDAIETAFEVARARFSTILTELEEELPLLRAEWHAILPLSPLVARRMLEAVVPFAAATFVIPKTSCPGAVPDSILAFFCTAPPF